ncbi:MAG: type III pantothenate kinase, partial [Flavobacteriales bacterium]
MNLIIDIGNTKIKFALFQGQTLLVNGSGDSKDFAQFIGGKEIDNTIISSVAISKEVEIVLRRRNLKYIHLSHKTAIPIANNYATPTSLGDDRLANVVAAAILHPDTNVLTIDCGTCIKFDVINKVGEYHGGAISPGLRMRFQALNHYTNGLPLIETESVDFFIGDSSKKSILSGVVNGTVQEIEGVIAQYHAVYDNLTVILTGGDASFFDKELKSNIFVEQKLTLIGLNEILLY